MTIPVEQQLLAIENTLDGIAILDAQGLYTYMNKSHANLFGYSSGNDLVGKSWKQIYTQEYIQKIEKKIFPVLMTIGSWSGETIGVSKEGKPVMQYISLTVLPNEGMICVCRDNSKAIDNNRLQYLMSNLGKSILIEDENHFIVLVNNDFCRMFHIPSAPSQMVGVNCLDSLDQALTLFHDPEEVRRGIMEKYAKQEVVIGEELIMADGRIFERDYIPVIIEGEFKGQLWSYADITPKREMQKSLIEARNQAIASEKAKSAFLSSMSHEIRTPMNAIMGLTEQLSMTVLTDEQNFFLENITESASSLLGIINDVLDLSKIEAGKMKIENEIINLNKINKSVENILRPKAEEKGLSLVTEIDSAIGERLFGDEVRIRQVLMNIVGNAIKFTNKGHVKLTINLIEKDEHTEKILLACCDTGIGISAEFVDQVFNDFFQEKNDNTNRAHGTGLGLSITKTLVDLMGGEISICSEKNQGTTVRIVLPMPVVQGELTVLADTPVQNTYLLEGKRVLIAEDNKLNKLVLRMMLENMKVQVGEANNGLEAIELLETQHFDLVLMDIQMPVMDGVTTLGLIKKQYGSAFPVIALTASAFKSEVDEMLNLGFADCITKPIDQKTLYNRLSVFFNGNSSKDKFFDSIHQKIVANINEMVNHDTQRAFNLIGYLLEEMEYALSEWSTALQHEDWVRAKQVLHREKAMIYSIGVESLNSLIVQIEDESQPRSSDTMRMMYDQLIELFEYLKKSLSPLSITS